jgi:small subunit ribosomal protein S16
VAVKLRLMRMGKKKQPTYRVVAADGRSPRDGRFIEIVGTYEPRADPSVVHIDSQKAVKWLSQGAQPTDVVQKLLEQSGVWDDYKAAAGRPVTSEAAISRAASKKAAAAAQ